MNSLHNKLLREKSAFAYASVCALVIGVGDLIATGTDIYWLIGDMRIQTHFHHYITMFGLVSAELIMIASFIWLYRAIGLYLTKKAKNKRQERKDYKDMMTRRDGEPHFCNKNKKVNHLKGVVEFED